MTTNVDVAFDGDAFGPTRPDVGSVLEQMWEKLQLLTGHLNNLPTEDPLVAGALWNDGGTVKVSAGEV